MLLGLEGIHDLNSSVGFRGQKEIKCVSKAHFPRHHSPDIKMLNFSFEVFKKPPTRMYFGWGFQKVNSFFGSVFGAFMQVLMLRVAICLTT